MSTPSPRGPLLYDPDSFDAPSAQVAMLHDVTRTRALLRAIRAVVRPGDVVLEIGTGTGILAVAAAKAGASRVYAIEAGGIARAAQALIDGNGVADVVTLVRGRSTDVELPERADVLVSEILGADPLDENMLEVFQDARARLLKPGARILPRSLSVYGLPVDLPEAFVERNTFSARDVARWRHLYGLDFDALRPYGAGIHRLPGITPQEAGTWPTVAEPCLLTRVALDQDFALAASASASLLAERPASRLGMLVFFEVELCAGVSLTTDPAKVPDHNHWGCRVWRFPQKPSIEAGERLDIEYVHDRDIVELRLR